MKRPRRSEADSRAADSGIIPQEYTDRPDLTPDLEQAQRFLRALAGAEPVTLQTFSDRDDLKVRRPDGTTFDPLARILHGTLEQHAAELTRLNRAGAGVFVMVASGDGRGRARANVTRARALFMDTDGAPYPDPLPLAPHIVVQSSPGRWHPYLLVDGLELGEFATLQRALAAHYASDPSVCDLPRVMRLPGFYHRKGAPVMTELLEVKGGAPYSRAEVFAAWPHLGTALEAEAAERAAAEAQRAAVRRRAQERRQKPDRDRSRAEALLAGHCDTVASAGAGTRHGTLIKAARTLGGYVGGGVLEAAAVEDALLSAALACGLGESESLDVIRWGLKHGANDPLELEEPVSLRPDPRRADDRDDRDDDRPPYRVLGAATLDDALASGHLWLAEGEAARAVHEVTGAPVLAAAPGKLQAVAGAVRAEKRRGQLALTIAADDAGQERAHRAALGYGAKVAHVGDLISPQHPDPGQAFAADIRRHHRRLGSATRGRYLSGLELPDGVTLLKAPHGTGKTEALRPLVDAELRAGGRVVYITPSAALTEEAARRLRLESYRDDLLRPHLDTVPGMAICLNSLPRLIAPDGTLNAPDLLILDESEQLTRALTGGHIRNRERVLEALLLLLRARRVVCADADLGKLTRTLLEQARPREHFHWREHYHPVGAGRTMTLHPTRDGLYGALSEVGAPAFVTTNSRAEAEALGAHLAQLGRRVRVLTGEHDSDSQRFLGDLEANARAEGLEYLVCSPTVRTGVSLTGGHFGRVFGVFHHIVGTPEDALQALWRVRTPAEYHLWIDPTVKREHVDLGAKYGATRDHEAAALGRRVGNESREYRAIRRAVEDAEQRARGAYRLGLLRLAALQGFAFETADSDPAHRGLAAAARDLAEQARQERIISQRERVASWGAAEVAQLDKARILEREDRDALECWRVSTFYRVGADDDLKAVLELDHRGRYRRRLERLELTLADDGTLQSKIDQLLEERTLADDLPALASRREFGRHVLEAVHFDAAAQLALASGEQLVLPRYTAETLEPLRAWIEDARPWLAGVVALPSPERLQENIVRHVGSWLRALGLKQKRTGDTHAGTYALELESLQTACRTMQKRHTLFFLESIPEKSVCPPETPPDDPAEWLAGLLAAGRLDSFGPQKLAIIRHKLQTGEHEWLRTLAQSADLLRVVAP